MMVSVNLSDGNDIKYHTLMQIRFFSDKHHAHIPLNPLACLYRQCHPLDDPLQLVLAKMQTNEGDITTPMILDS